MVGASEGCGVRGDFEVGAFVGELVVWVGDEVGAFVGWFVCGWFVVG